MAFKDRDDAGRLLAARLETYRHDPRVVVVGLARGGVVVARTVATELGVPLDVMMVRKLGVPHDQEVAMGAIATGGVRVMNDDIVASLHIPPATIEAVVQRESRELQRREQLYRQGRSALELAGKTVIVVDDGLATGASMQAAVASLRQRRAARIVVAVPVSPPGVCDELGRNVDEILCAVTADPFVGVSFWYENFDQTTDAEVAAALALP